MCSLLLISAKDLNVKRNIVKKVIIDAGHGGKDPGCLGKYSTEKDVAFDIAKMLGQTINMYYPEVQVIFTRKSKTEFVELRDRANIANKENADLFISIHCNASEKSNILGTETYVMGLGSSDENMRVAMRENGVIEKETDYLRKYDGFDPSSSVSHILLANFQNAYQDRSLMFASNVESQFKSYLNRPSRGVKQSGFLVLWKTAMPSVLVEVGFLTNENDEKYLNTEKNKSYIAASIYKAFRDYKTKIENGI